MSSNVDNGAPSGGDSARSAEIAERQLYIDELEKKLNRPPRLGVKPWVSVFALVLCGVMLFQKWPDAEFFFSSREPIQLGAEGDYRFDAARNNRFAQIHGVPTSRAGFGADGSKTVVAIGLRDTPIMVWRGALPGEDWTPGRKPPPPNQTPFSVKGRLLARGQAPGKYSEGFATLDRLGEVSAQWVLVESERPGTDWLSSAFFAALVMFAAFNGWLLVKSLRWPKASSSR